MKEIWKDIVGYEGRYKVSNLGRVLSTGVYLDGRIYEPKFIKQRKDIGGYMTVGLYKGRKGKTFKVHRLVAMSFIPNPNNLPCVDHINTNRADNKVENLRWVTHVENCNNVLTKKHIKESAKKAFNNPEIRKERSKKMMAINDIVVEKRRKTVLQFDLKGNLVSEYKSIRHAAKIIGGHPHYITFVCRGEWKQYKGFVWKYKENAK